MKTIAHVLSAVLLALIAFPTTSGAKTKVELKDAQGKDVGSVSLWDQGPVSRSNSSCTI